MAASPSKCRDPYTWIPACGLALALLLLGGCDGPSYAEHLYPHHDVETRLFGIWKDDRFSHGVVATPLALLKGVDVRVTGSEAASMSPLEEGVTVLPDGVYVDGEQKHEAGEEPQLFLVTEDGLEPVPLDQEAAASLHRDRVEELKGSPAWKRIRRAIADARDDAGGEPLEEADGE